MNILTKLLTIAILSNFTFFTSAQIYRENAQWTHYLEDLAEANNSNETELQNLFDDLSYLCENPFNLHSVTKNDLERLPFLSDLQIENLLYYIYRYSPLVDLYELKNVEELDMQTIAYLLPFVYIGETEKTNKRMDWKNLWKYSKQEFALQTNFTVQEKAGYKDFSEEENSNKQYLGEPFYLAFRYGLNYKDRILFGMSGEKDPGEAFWNKNHHGFDFYAFNLTLKNFGKLNTLHLGDYRLSFGQGLVLNTNFSMGKTADAVNINQKNGGIKRHVSTNENQFFRGIAATFKLGSVQTSVFYSHRSLDANVDSLDIRSFKTDGLHRTIADLEKRNTVSTDFTGANIQWQNERITIGTTGVYYSFGSKTVNPNPKLYNIYYLRGSEFFNAGLHYSFRHRKFLFQGETASDKEGKIASLNHLIFKPASFIDWVISQRYYSKGYKAFYANAFSESSGVQNEKGIYMGTKIRLNSRCEISAYYDFFIFPWLKSEIDSPSSGNDALVQLTYAPKRNWQMNLRYRYKEKSQSVLLDSHHEKSVLPYEQHKWRYQSNYQPNSKVNFRTQADYNLYINQKGKENSWSVTQSASFAPDKNRFQLDASLAYFHTGNWDSRISIYEKNILYSFSFPSYYGEGLRYYAVVKWKITNPLTMYFKAASTHYFDRNSISSGLEEITGREKTDIYCLVRYKF